MAALVTTKPGVRFGVITVDLVAMLHALVEAMTPLYEEEPMRLL